MPEKDVPVPVPVNVEPPGWLVMIHVPDDGSPVRATVPDVTAQVGGVIFPTTGGGGVCGWAAIVMFAEAAEVHPSFLTVKL